MVRIILESRSHSVTIMYRFCGLAWSGGTCLMLVNFSYLLVQMSSNAFSSIYKFYLESGFPMSTSNSLLYIRNNTNILCSSGLVWLEGYMIILDWDLNHQCMHARNMDGLSHWPTYQRDIQEIRSVLRCSEDITNGNMTSSFFVTSKVFF
jgi:hypothetical protein